MLSFVFLNCKWQLSCLETIIILLIKVIGIVFYVVSSYLSVSKYWKPLYWSWSGFRLLNGYIFNDRWSIVKKYVLRICFLFREVDPRPSLPASLLPAPLLVDCSAVSSPPVLSPVDMDVCVPPTCDSPTMPILTPEVPLPTAELTSCLGKEIFKERNVYKLFNKTS